jgi:hypothetical protein
MKKLDLPEQVLNNFIPETMNKEPKNNLEHFKEKPQTRDRAYTYNENNFQCKFLYNKINQASLSGCNFKNKNVLEYYDEYDELR